LLFKAISAASAVLAQPAPAPAQLPDANPALWVVQDADTTVYLFGTFHTLDGSSDWFNDEVETAFAQSDELILETMLPKPGRRLPAVRGSSPLDHGVTPSASFVSATRMVVRAGRQRGLDVQKGADMVLRSAAEDAGKTVLGLETVEFQLTMLRRMAAAADVAARPTRAAGRAPFKIGQLMSEMQASWSRGDQHIFTSLLEDMQQDTPGNYRMMFPERNATWADWVVQRMERPGTVFVAVGAGHFAGPDSVLANLSSRGAVATRIN
jgi:uncharacterized protein YbaP (TraB family)